MKRFIGGSSEFLRELAVSEGGGVTNSMDNGTAELNDVFTKVTQHEGTPSIGGAESTQGV